MNSLTLQVRPVTEEAMSTLEERGLLRRLFPRQQVLDAPEGSVAVDVVYTSDPQYGSHMLICAGFNRSTVELAVHPDGEEFLLINEGRRQKPLILVISQHPEPELRRLVASGQLGEDDIWALELKFNDPRLSFFTMNANTPHCEWTPPGPGPASVFWVTEPSGLEVLPLDMGGYTFEIAHTAVAGDG